MRLAISRLYPPIITVNRLHQCQKSTGLGPSNVLSPLIALASEMLLLDFPMIMMSSMYQVAVH